MNNKEIALAILHIRPNSEFTVFDDDIENLIWLDEKQTKPTKSEIESGWLAYQAKIEADKVEALAKRAAAEAKLAAIGLSADDLKALGLRV